MAWKKASITEGVTKFTKAFGDNSETGIQESLNATVDNGLNALLNGVSTSGDQTANISTFFDLCHAEGKNAYFPKGVYESGQIVKAYGLNITGAPGAEITTKSGTSGDLWVFEGSLGSAAELGTAAVAGTRVLEGLTAATRKAGEILKISTITQVPNNGGAGGGTRYCGQLVQISNVVSTTKVELRERLYREFTVTAGADVTKVTPVAAIQGMNVVGLKFVNPTEANCRFLLIKKAQNVDIDVETDMPLQPAVEVQDVYGFRITSRSEHGQHDNTTKFGYAVMASAGSCHGQVNSVNANGNFAFTNSGVNSVAGEPYDITVTGICDNSTKAGVFLHPEGHDFLVTGFAVLNATENGIEVACPKAVVQGCTITGVKENGVRVTTGGTSKVRIVGNTITECEGNGVYLNNTNTISDCTVAENTLDTISKVGILSSGALIRYRQHGNTIRNYGTLKESGATYAGRYLKSLESSSVYDETADATGANNTVFLFGEACTLVDVVNNIVKSVGGGGTSWLSTVSGVTFSGNVINGEPESVPGTRITSATIKTAQIENGAVTEAKIAEGAVKGSRIAEEGVTHVQIQALAVERAKIKNEAVNREKLELTLSKAIPLEHGRTAAMSGTPGKIVVAAPAVTTTGSIIVSAEGTPIAVTVTARVAGEGFTVEATGASTARINWAVWE